MTGFYRTLQCYPGSVNSDFSCSLFLVYRSRYYHTAAITEDGHLWTWGHGGSGRLGHGDEANRWRPTRVTTGLLSSGDDPHIIAVREVACGAEHTVAILDVVGSGQAQVCTFGNG